MFVSIYYKPSLFNAHTMILIVHTFMTVNKLCLNQEEGRERNRETETHRETQRQRQKKRERETHTHTHTHTHTDARLPNADSKRRTAAAFMMVLAHRLGPNTTTERHFPVRAGHTLLYCYPCSLPVCQPTRNADSRDGGNIPNTLLSAGYVATALPSVINTLSSSLQGLPTATHLFRQWRDEHRVSP